MVDITGAGKFVDEVRYPSTWNPEEAQAAWSVSKEKAKEAGVDVLDWLSETAFGGTKNPEGWGQQALAKISYPFRLANEMSVDYLGTKPSMRSIDPVGGLFGLVAGGFGIPANKWATGEDVTNLDAIIGALTATGPVVGGAVRGTTSLAKKMVPEAAQESVDLARRKVLKAAGVATGGMLAPVIATKVALKGAAATVAGNVAVAAGGMAETFMLSIGKLLDNAVEELADVSKVVRASDPSPSSMIKMTKEQTATRNFFERFREIIEDSLGTSEKGHPVNAIQRIRDDTSIASLGDMTDVQRDYLKGLTQHEYMSPEPSARRIRIHDVLTDESTEVMTALKAEQKSIKTAQRKFDEEWHVDEAYEGGWVDEPQYTRHERITDISDPQTRMEALKAYESLVKRLEDNEDAIKTLYQSAQDVKWGLMHIEHLSQTDPDKLIRVLNQIINEAKLAPKGKSFDELMELRGFGLRPQNKQLVLEDRSEMLRTWRVHGNEDIGNLARQLLKELGEEPDAARILSGDIGRTYEGPTSGRVRTQYEGESKREFTKERYFDEEGRLDEYAAGRRSGSKYWMSDEGLRLRPQKGKK